MPASTLYRRSTTAGAIRNSGGYDRPCIDGRIAVVSNNIQGMEDLVTYVLQRGHRKIAYIHGEDSSVTRSRLGSFYRTLQKKHIDVPDEYMPVIPYRDAEAAAMATSELLDLKDPPTCILYPDDFSALGVSTKSTNEDFGYQMIFPSQDMMDSLCPHP